MFVSKENSRSRAISNSVGQIRSSRLQRSALFVDNRPEAIVQRKLRAIANNSLTIQQTSAFRDILESNSSAEPTAHLQPVDAYYQNGKTTDHAFGQAKPTSTGVAQRAIDSGMPVALYRLLKEQTHIVDKIAEYNVQEKRLFKADLVNPFAMSDEPADMEPAEREKVIQALLRLSGSIIFECLNIKKTNQYRAVVMAKPEYGNRFERLLDEASTHRRRLHRRFPEPQKVDYVGYYKKYGHIALLERIRKDYDIGTAQQYIFLGEKAFLEKAISMGYDRTDLEAGIGANPGATIGGPALSGRERSPVSYMYINETLVRSWLGSNLQNIVQTMFHEYQHVQQMGVRLFLNQNSGESDIPLMECHAYCKEIIRFRELLRESQGETSSLPDASMAGDAVNSFLVYYDMLTPNQKFAYKNAYNMISRVLFEIRANTLDPLRAILKVLLPALYTEDKSEKGAYEQF